MSQDTPLSTDAVMKMFRCDDFPSEALIVRLNRTSQIEGATDPESTVTVADNTSQSSASLIGSACQVPSPSTVIVRGYISSEVNPGNPQPIVFLTTLDPIAVQMRRKSPRRRENNKEPLKVPAERIPGGKAFEFFGGMAHVLSNPALSGNVIEEEVTKFLQNHQAIQSLATNSSGGTAFHHHQAAIAAFAASQFDRQKASLTSNTGRESAEKAAQIASQHQDALKQALQDTDKPLTPQLLCQWHGILMKDLCRNAGVVRPKNVRVGQTEFRRSSAVMVDLTKLCQSLMTLESRLLRHRDQNMSLGVAAATFAAAVFFGLIDTHAFQDGNGRLSRIACNWALKRAGVPFCVHLFATPAQRQEHVTAIVYTRRNTYLVGRGDFPQEALVEAFEKAGALGPLVKLIVDRLTKAIVECNKLIEEKSTMYEEQTEAQAARKFRERAAQGTCNICFEDSPNIATLCCGKAVHLNCMATWLSTKDSCPNCRADMPSLPESMKPPAPSENNNDDTTDDTSVNISDNDDTSTTDTYDDPDVQDPDEAMSNDDTSTTDEVDDDTLPQPQAEQVQVAADDTTTDEDTTSMHENNGNSNQDDTSTTEDSTGDTSSVQQNQQRDLPPLCANCNNRAARDCANSRCGRCCLLNGQYRCNRHS